MQKELYLDSSKHVAFDTGCGVSADAEGRWLTVNMVADFTGDFTGGDNLVN